MFKKVLKGIAIGAAVLGMAAGTATAKDIDVNLYGASAQHKFWLNLAPDFLQSANIGCDTVTEYTYNKKHGMAVGDQCDVTANNADKITIRYSSRASYDGVNAVLNKVSGGLRDMCDTGCSNLTPVAVNLGASDVAGTSFVQATQGWEDGNQGFPGTSYTANASALSFPTASEVATLDFFNPIVVPFAFYVNNSVCEYRCTQPHPVPAGAEYAYSMWDRSCVPNAGARTGSGLSDDCIGYYKCIDNVCLDGNQGTGNERTCVTAEECADGADASHTMCTEMPLQNVTQSMVRQIFGATNTLTDWSDFGDEYCSGAIQLCMRHAGSGTHATFDLGVMQGVNMVTNSVPVGANQKWHFTSSSDLTKCVTDLAGAIGYADADKLLKFKNVGVGGGINGAHVVKYNGAAATRRNVVNGIYEFWAAQWVYYLASDYTADADLETVRAEMETFSSDQANLTAATLGTSASYWAAQAEMKVTRDGDGQPIKRK